MKRLSKNGEDSWENGKGIKLIHFPLLMSEQIRIMNW
jgi:hypothetical protein